MAYMAERIFEAHVHTGLRILGGEEAYLLDIAHNKVSRLVFVPAVVESERFDDCTDQARG